MLSSIPIAPQPLVLLGALPTLDSDCACPAAPSPPSRPRRDGGLYQRTPDLHMTALGEDWVLVCNTLAGGAPAVLNAAAMLRLESFATPRILGDTLDRQLADAYLVAAPGANAT